MTVMEQWLEQIEGDPSYLMLNQFRIEEQRELQRSGRQLMETRPW
jgi:Ca-activated chloride channel family protein